jgi:hypothetical protein
MSFSEVFALFPLGAVMLYSVGSIATGCVRHVREHRARYAPCAVLLPSVITSHT